MSSSKFSNGCEWAIWRSLLGSCGVVILLVIAQSIASGHEALVSPAPTAGLQLEGKLKGPFKWLLHLGQNPADRFLTWYAPDPKGLEPWMGCIFMPFPG